ncbi:MAG: diaminopimelate epimerase [Clostridia bacterium]|nr:diaminopimelate epimerase [Clostridia bacterium]
MNFIKLEALGNDYVYVNAEEVKGCDLVKLARKVSNRRFGVGSDGLIIVQKLTNSTITMTMFNADGSEGAMCGNGVRGAVFFALKNLGLATKTVKVITKSREVIVNAHFDNLSDVSRFTTIRATADMGKVKSSINPSIIAEELAKVGLYVDKRQVLHVDVGNPHLVFFEPNYPLSTICLAVIRSGLFPDGVNVERVYKIKNISENQSKLFMEVSERGTGKTLSCGSGAVASAYAFSVYSYRPLDGNLNVDVTTEGGTLNVTFEGCKAFLTGEVNEVFEGVFNHSEFMVSSNEI